ncbi:MAG TPA: cytochrome c biogenesis protein CcsA [Pseudomonadales bacterium]|jgi:ABC-type uncharacterized transport system permease subunit
MFIQICGFAAIALYLACTAWLLVRMRAGHPAGAPAWLALTGLALHGFTAWSLVHLPTGYDLGFFRIATLIFVMIILISWISSLRLPIRSLLVLVYPMAALSILLAISTTDTYQPREFPAPIAAHILLSILAYSVITIATLQALILALQDHWLRQHQFGPVMAVLPPLEIMETLLFRMIAVGVLLLGLSIGTGLVFFDNLFAQHLVHKTVFSIIALIVFGILLWGRHALGWRSHTALRWTLAGFTALMLAFFGSKFVLEFLLHPG